MYTPRGQLGDFFAAGVGDGTATITAARSGHRRTQTSWPTSLSPNAATMCRKPHVSPQDAGDFLPSSRQRGEGSHRASQQAVHEVVSISICARQPTPARGDVPCCRFAFAPEGGCSYPAAIACGWMTPIPAKTAVSVVAGSGDDTSTCGRGGDGTWSGGVSGFACLTMERLRGPRR